MDTQHVSTLIREADRMLLAADQEMMRSEEDAITHTVCFHARQSLLNYLTVFLLNNGVRPEQPVTLAGLLAQCRNLDGRFDLISLENIHCRFESDHQDYCLSVDQVDECLQVAKQTREITLADAPGY